jgi:hypothetical protein
MPRSRLSRLDWRKRRDHAVQYLVMLTCAKRLIVKDGKMQDDKLTFDRNKIRSAKAA